MITCKNAFNMYFKVILHSES